MAISAKFEADFSQFVEAADKANGSLSRIEGSSKNVESALSSMTGGAERLAAAFGIAFTAEKLVEFVKDAVEGAARLEELHLATGVSAEGIQRLGYVAKGFGVDLEEMAHGVEQFSAKLASGDPNATRAVEMLGLSVKGLIAAGPEEAFLQFAEAAGRIEDPMQRGGVAADAFGGKLAKTLLPMLGELRQKMNDVPKEAVISDENIKKANEFETALSHGIIRMKAWTVGFLGMLRDTAKGISQGRLFTNAVEETNTALDTQSKKHGEVITSADLLANRLRALRSDAIDPLTDAQRGQIAELSSYGVNQKEIAQLVGTSEIAVKRFTDSLIEQGRAVKAAAADAQAWDDMLQHLAHVAMQDVIKSTIALDKADMALSDRRSVAMLREFDAQQQLNAAYGVDAFGAIMRQKTAYDVLQDRLESLHQLKVENISQAKEEQVLTDAYTTALYRESMAEDEVIQKLVSKATETAAALKADQEAADAADAAFRNYRNSIKLVASSLSDLNAQLTSFYDKLASVANVGNLSGASGIGALSAGPTQRVIGPAARAGGGPVDAGTSYLVGERGPELYTPSASGFITPNGGGGGKQIINVMLDGRVIASVVNDVNTRNMKTSRQYPSA